MVDFKVQVYDGSYHEVDSSEMAFKIAGSMAFKEGMRKADPVIMCKSFVVCCLGDNYLVFGAVAYYLLRHVTRHFGIMVESHGVLSASLRATSEVGSITDGKS